MTEYLDLEDLLGMVEHLDVGPVRDLGLLDSAAARPRAAMFGEDAYPSLAEKAAALLHSLACNHGLVDGNKRLAWHATEVFLTLNGHHSALDDDAAFSLLVALADRRVTEVKAIADMLTVAEL
ncbi:MAG: type II toxin-antitoxin system death-on-curing family toxin [Acidimicrobiia bacterium]